MKKTYMHPEMKVIKIRNRALLLSSDPKGVKTNDYLGDEFLDSDVSY